MPDEERVATHALETAPKEFRFERSAQGEGKVVCPQ